MRPFDCHQVWPCVQILRPGNHPKLRPLFVTQNMSHWPKSAYIWKSKGDRCLESVLIDSDGISTPRVPPISNFFLKLQNFWGKVWFVILYLSARTRAHGPIIFFPETCRKKLIYHHGVPMGGTSWHSNHCWSCFFSWAGPQYMACKARARMVPYFQNDLDLRPNCYFILEYSLWLQVEVIRTPLYGQINPF